MRKISFSSGKKVGKQINNTKLSQLTNTLFLSSLVSDLSNNFIVSTNKSNISKRLSTNKDNTNRKQINSNQYNLFEQPICSSTMYSKRLTAKLNEKVETRHSESNTIRPKTSDYYSANRGQRNNSGHKNSQILQQNKSSNGPQNNSCSKKFKSPATINHFKDNIQSSNQHQQMKTDYLLAEPDMIIQKTGSKPSKSIYSNKPIGMVRGYSVNSHRFYINPSQPSEARISIVANLTKIIAKERAISLYSLFESNSVSSVYIEYLRQNFSIQIASYLSNVPIPPITIQMVQQCLKKIQKKFCDYYLIGTNRSQSSSPNKRVPKLNLNKDISFAMVFVRNSQMTVCLKGECQISISSNCATKINKVAVSTMKSQANSTLGIKLKIYRKEETRQFDFLTLSSYGVTAATQFQTTINKGSGWIHRQIWLAVMNQIITLNQQIVNNSHPQYSKYSIHELLGRAIDSLMGLYTTSLSAKNISIICLGFRNLQSLMLNCDRQNNLSSRQEGSIKNTVCYNSTPSNIANDKDVAIQKLGQSRYLLNSNSKKQQSNNKWAHLQLPYCGKNGSIKQCDNLIQGVMGQLEIHDSMQQMQNNKGQQQDEQHEQLVRQSSHTLLRNFGNYTLKLNTVDFSTNSEEIVNK